MPSDGRDDVLATTSALAAVAVVTPIPADTDTMAPQVDELAAQTPGTSERP